MEQKNRSNAITKTGIVGVVANLFLAALKIIAGLLSGSIAIVLDAVNNTTDALSSVITIAGIKLAGRRPDSKHPFGYGRIEYFSAIIIAAMVLVAGGVSFIEAIKRVLRPEVAEYDVVTIAIIVAGIVVKIALGKYVKSVGVKYNSDALIASGSEASFDAILSISTLCGAVVTMLFGVTIDGLIATVISVFIVKTGFELLIESVENVIGVRPDSEITKAIKAAVNQIPGVLGTYDLIIHNYGPDTALGSLHVEINNDMSAQDIHILTKKIQRRVLEEYKVVVTVGFYALDSEHAQIREEIKSAVTSVQGVQGCHGVYVNDAERLASFDAVLDFTVKNRPEAEEQIRSEIKKLLPDYEIVVNFDTNYTV